MHDLPILPSSPSQRCINTASLAITPGLIIATHLEAEECKHNHSGDIPHPFYTPKIYPPLLHTIFDALLRQAGLVSTTQSIHFSLTSIQPPLFTVYFLHFVNVRTRTRWGQCEQINASSGTITYFSFRFISSSRLVLCSRAFVQSSDLTSTSLALPPQPRGLREHFASPYHSLLHSTLSTRFPLPPNYTNSNVNSCSTFSIDVCQCFECVTFLDVCASPPRSLPLNNMNKANVTQALHSPIPSQMT